MKQLLYFIFLCFLTLLSLLFPDKARSQNVGIGTTTPQATLDVRGNQRIGGINKSLAYDSLSGKFSWGNSYLFLPAPQYILQHSASAEGLFYGNSQLEYRNFDGTPRFFTNWSSGNGYFFGNLGIGTTSPAAKLHITNGSSGYSGFYFPGAVIEGSTNTYLNFLTPDGSESAVLFGKASDAASGGIVYNNAGNPNGLQFRTNGNANRMVITNTGNTGIGNSNPSYLLDLNGRMRIRSGGSNIFSAGIWFNNNANTEAAFFGMEDDTHIGMFGNGGANWKFTMNTQNGALKINGTEGQNGQLLRSNGVGQAASWSNPLNALYNNMSEFTQSGTSIINPLSSLQLPGISGISLVINSVSKVMFSSSVQLLSNSCFGCGGSTARVLVQVNFPGGSAQDGGTMRSDMGSGETKTFVTGTKIFTLNPGTYIINTIAENNNLSGPSLTASFGRLDIIVIQQ
jgi:hypothetical protein